MIKARPPKKTHPSRKAVVAGLIIAVIHAIFIIFLIKSGWTAAVGYIDLTSGKLPSEIQKMELDYSITIFAGTAAFLLLYKYKFEEIVYELFDVKRVEPIKDVV